MRALAVMLFVTAVGCGDDGPMTTDGGIDDGAIPDVALPPVPACQPSIEPTGCQSDDECAPDACLADRTAGADLDPLTQRCGPIGAGGATAEPCSTGDECSHGVCVAAGRCARPCVDDVGCGPGLRCGRVWARADRGTHRATRACVRRYALPADVVTDMRVLRLSMDAQVMLESTAPSTLHILEPPCSVAARIEELRAAGDDSLLFSLASLSNTTPSLNPVSPGLRPLTILVPSGAGSGADLRARLRVGSEADMTMHTMSRDGTVPDGRQRVLDLDVFFVGGRGWAPVGARGPDELDAALSSLSGVLIEAGIRLGEVRQHGIFGALRDRLSVIEREPDGTRPELSELFALGAGLSSPGVALFLVRSIDGPLLGFSGGIPGPWGLPGSEGGGVVVSADLLSGEELAAALVHELLHYLGLFHTTEATGVVIEGLPDTPICDPSRDGNGDGLLAAEECVGAGDDNIMFWSASGETLSPTQRVIIGRALVLDTD